MEAVSVHILGLREATDPAILEEAKKAGAVVMSKDNDFSQLQIRAQELPKTIPQKLLL